MKQLQLMLATLGLLIFTPFTQTSHGRPYIGFGIRIGPGYFYGPGPYYSGYGYPYYVPGPIVYDTAPPIVVRQAAPVIEAVPAPVAPNPPPPPPLPANVVPTQNVAPTPTRMDSLLSQLRDPSETVRRDAAMDLGRMKAQKAVDPLIQLLSKDASPIARDGAARALGLIASPRSLNALIYASQADNDRDVRHSSQFAVEIIRTNLRN
jgi:HEAT repeats